MSWLEEEKARNQAAAVKAAKDKELTETGKKLILLSETDDKLAGLSPELAKLYGPGLKVLHDMIAKAAAIQKK
jgi:hypothetical protein